MRKIIGFILILAFIYGVYIGVECYRVHSSNTIIKPLFLLDATSTSEEMTFKSVGYKVVYKIEREKASYDLETITTKESKFILFDIFTLFTKYYTKE